MLRVDVIGNLGGDPQVTVSQKGNEQVLLNVAVNQVRTDQNGERRESTEWFRVRAMNNLVERAKVLAKGNRVFVAGRCDIGHYVARDGEQRTSYDVWADEITSLTQRPQAEDGRPMPATAKGGAGRSDDGYEPDTDLPF
jgi:single-strand DNA-binding protein